jgi:hypothetical protein
MEIKQKMELEVAKKMAAANEAKAETMLHQAQGELRRVKVEANRKTDILANLGVDPFGTNTPRTQSREEYGYEDEGEYEPRQPRRPRQPPKRDMLGNLKDCF